MKHGPMVWLRLPPDGCNIARKRYDVVAGWRLSRATVSGPDGVCPLDSR